jgi:hypothetical protein
MKTTSRHLEGICQLALRIAGCFLFFQLRSPSTFFLKLHLAPRDLQNF